MTRMRSCSATSPSPVEKTSRRFSGSVYGRGRINSRAGRHYGSEETSRSTHMANAQLSAVLRQAREMADTQDPTDAELIDRFIAGRDEAAFAALLERHGPMVLSVCRRVLRQAQDAE